MPRWLALVPALLAVAEGAALAAETVPSLCRAEEQTFFACQTAPGGRIVSLCGMRPLTAERGALAYRFGRPGRIELAFPDNAADSPRRFAFAHYFRARLDETEVSFVNKGYRYTLFDRTDGEMGKPWRERGVRVGRIGGEAEMRLTCVGPTVSRLPLLETIIPCDVNNPLTMGSCPAR